MLFAIVFSSNLILCRIEKNKDINYLASTANLVFDEKCRFIDL